MYHGIGWAEKDLLNPSLKSKQKKAFVGVRNGAVMSSADKFSLKRMQPVIPHLISSFSHFLASHVPPDLKVLTSSCYLLDCLSRNFAQRWKLVQVLNHKILMQHL